MRGPVRREQRGHPVRRGLALRLRDRPRLREAPLRLARRLARPLELAGEAADGDLRAVERRTRRLAGRPGAGDGLPGLAQRPLDLAMAPRLLLRHRERLADGGGIGVIAAERGQLLAGAIERGVGALAPLVRAPDVRGGLARPLARAAGGLLAPCGSVACLAVALDRCLERSAHGLGLPGRARLHHAERLADRGAQQREPAGRLGGAIARLGGGLRAGALGLGGAEVCAIAAPRGVRVGAGLRGLRTQLRERGLRALQRGGRL